jgi:hypothetical protein
MSLTKINNEGKIIGGSNSPKNKTSIKRVVDVVLNNSHPAWNHDGDTGKIFFTDEKNQEIAKDTLSLPFAVPNDRSNYKVPEIGDLVNITQGPSPDYYPDIEGNPIRTQNFYSNPLNIYNNTTSNAVPNAENQLNLTSEVNVQSLTPNSGDTITEGRAGQRIRMSKSGSDSRSIKLTLGNNPVENIRGDGASIYLVDGEGCAVDPSSFNVDSLKSNYEPIVDDPLVNLEKAPDVDIPSNDLGNQQSQEFSFDFGEAQEKPGPNAGEFTPGIIDDPIFNALDEAASEDLITIVSEEIIELSGTDNPDSEVENQSTPDDAGLEEATPAGASYIEINIQAEQNWKEGKEAIFKNNAGGIISLPQSDPDLKMNRARSRQIDFIILHMTAGNIRNTPANIMRFFLNPDNPSKEGIQGRNWKFGGYHWIIEQSGDATRVYSDEIQTNGAEGYNPRSIHINWIGGAYELDISNQQSATIKELLEKYLDLYPNAKVLGHNQIKNKACPRFYVPQFCKNIGIEEANIFEGTDLTGPYWRNDNSILTAYTKAADEITKLLI